MTELEVFKQALNEGVSNKFDKLAAQAEGIELPPRKPMWWEEGYDPDVDVPMKDLITPSTLTPGGDCLGDGSHEGYRFMCHECPYAATCAPELQ
jgi:hypothetical protein